MRPVLDFGMVKRALNVKENVKEKEIESWSLC